MKREDLEIKIEALFKDVEEFGYSEAHLENAMSLIDELVPDKPKGKHSVANSKIAKIDFNALLGFLNSVGGRTFRIVNESVKKKYRARLREGYTKEMIQNAIVAAHNSEHHINNNFQYLTLEFFSRSDKLDMYGTKKIETKEKFNPYD